MAASGLTLPNLPLLFACPQFRARSARLLLITHPEMLFMGLVLGFFFYFSAIFCRTSLPFRAAELLENLQNMRSSAQTPQGGACAGG